MDVAGIRAFTIDVPQAALDDLRNRLALTRWPEKETVDDWDQGVPLAYAQELAAYWQDRYDWRAVETRLNSYPNFLATVDGLFETAELPVVLEFGGSHSVGGIRGPVDAKTAVVPPFVWIADLVAK